ncbi:uncharacterized protein BYT42DRAFT_584537 [Radiomyces spectabilis]|uniref:uncharacterized protein n=1 Tax=Radiomyces spectabilis TaxID=64574 RepID=UPI00221EC080|nr:uncharacterized protein BYT42DRAFT_584537 [Radiomyces spectabilis]KAI8369454.1 hypothetical protein BYT42DRAFT_584537 [Radiomyces spectabilis]
MMASKSPAKPATTKQSDSAASHDIGLIFVREYYTFLNKKPQRLHAFYGTDSVLVRGDEGDAVRSYQGQEEIRQKFEELNFEDCKVLVTQLDSQMSSGDGIIIQVLGEMCNKDGPSQKFAQTFFLAPQPNGYYVLNDIFRFLKDEVNIDYYTCDEEEEQEQQQQQQHHQQPLSAPADSSRASVSEKPTPTLSVAESYDPMEMDSTAATTASTPVIDSVSVASDKVSKPESVTPKPSPITEDQKPKTPAPKVADKEEQTPKNKVEEGNKQVPVDEKKPETASPTSQQPKPAPKPTAPKTWATLAANDSNKWGTQASETKLPPVAASPTPQLQQPATQTPASQPHPAQQQQQQQQQQQPQSQGPQGPQGHGGRDQRRVVIDETQIFVKNVNQNVTEDLLREAFAKNGTIKSVTMAYNRNCAFVEFATPEACQKALSQHKVYLSNGTTVLAEERRHNKGQFNRQQPNGPAYDRRFQQNRRGGGPTRGGSNKPRGSSGPK